MACLPVKTKPKHKSMKNFIKPIAIVLLGILTATSCNDDDNTDKQEPSIMSETLWVMTDADNTARQVRLNEADYLQAADNGRLFDIVCKDGSKMNAIKSVNIDQVEITKTLDKCTATQQAAAGGTRALTPGTYVQFTITKTDGTTANVVRTRLDVTQDEETNNWKIGVYDISEIKSLEVSLGTNGYEAPQYPDNYVDAGIAGWDQRSQWNLANVHDPSVVPADDGYYYMYTTDASYGNAHTGHGHFMCRRSKNLVDWEFIGASMQKLPEWVKPKLNEIRKAMGLKETDIDFNDETQFGFWAPCVRKVKTGLYRMYYSITMPGYINGEKSWGERAFIGMMETADPATNLWTDKGYVITNSSDKGLDFNVNPTDYAKCYYKYNAIDPSYIITENGEHWLIYGSWHSGIAALQLDAESGMPKTALGNPWGDDISAYGKTIYTRTAGNRWQASEGPEVVYHNGYYYLFLAYDAVDVPYNTRVARSKNIDGPYEDLNGNDVTTGGDLPMLTHPYKMAADDHGWVGISHCAVFNDGKGNWFYASQQRFPNNWNGNLYSNAIMQGGVRRIIWTESGWPVVMPECYGNVPEHVITEDEISGKSWKHIVFKYDYGKQCEAVDLTLGTDHKIVCPSWNDGAEWSFDEASQTLTISGVKLYLARETDWESSDRHATIVYSGMNSSKGMPYWGKMEL